MPRSLTLAAFFESLAAALDRLDDRQMEEELRDALTPEQLVGLDKKIKVSLHTMIERMQQTS